MPLYTIEDSKFVSETISIVQDFSDMLIGGETIVGTPTITITLLTGTDSNPNNLLYLGITTTSSKVEQRFRRGIPGCIYSIVYTVITTFPHTYEKETFLAVLPMEGNVTPVFTPLNVSSSLYPYFYQEFYKGIANFSGGILFLQNIVYSEPVESYKGLSPSFLGGTLPDTVVHYNNWPPEQYKAVIPSFLGGTITLSNIIYSNWPSEQYKSPSVAFLGGTITLGNVIYSTYAPEQYKATSPSFLGGTLV